MRVSLLGCFFVASLLVLTEAFPRDTGHQADRDGEAKHAKKKVKRQDYDWDFDPTDIGGWSLLSRLDLGGVFEEENDTRLGCLGCCGPNITQDAETPGSVDWGAQEMAPNHSMSVVPRKKAANHSVSMIPRKKASNHSVSGIHRKKASNHRMRVIPGMKVNVTDQLGGHNSTIIRCLGCCANATANATVIATANATAKVTSNLNASVPSTVIKEASDVRKKKGKRYPLMT